MKKYISILITLLTFTSHTTYPHEPIEQAFVTFATQDYFPLLEVLLESVHQFSSRPIIAFGINADLPFSQNQFPRLIKRRIDTPLSARPHIYFQKFNIILQSNVQYGIYVEADDIVNYGIDQLFECCKKVGKFPLSPIHPHDPGDQQNVMRLLEVPAKTNPYVHAHIIFSQECMPFIQECYDACMRLQETIGANWDETVLNVMLWKYGVKDHYLPIYDPYFSYYQSYIAGAAPADLPGPVQYHMFHGCKYPGYARYVLGILKANAGKPIAPR